MYFCSRSNLALYVFNSNQVDSPLTNAESADSFGVFRKLATVLIYLTRTKQTKINIENALL